MFLKSVCSATVFSVLVQESAGFSAGSICRQRHRGLLTRFEQPTARATASPEDPDDKRPDKDLYASLRARLEAVAEKQSNGGVREEPTDEDTDIPFFAEEDRAEKAQQIQTDLEEFDMTQTSKLRGAEYLAWDRQRDSVGIARATVQSLVLLSFSAFAVFGLSYGILGSKLVHERGDMRAVQYQIPSIPRYADPDALLREEEPEGTDYSSTDQLLYNQLFDGTPYRSASNAGSSSDETRPA